MNGIQVFSSDEFGEIQAVSIDGAPWLYAKPVCDALGIATNHLKEDGRGLDDDEVMNLPNWEVGGRAPLIISEAGFYKLVMRSRKTEAKAFQRWVTHEVLPTIRKHGAYATPATIEKLIASPDFGIRLLSELKAEQEKRQALEAENTKQKAQIDEMLPKALFADSVAASDGTCLVGELAKMMRQNGVQVGQNRMFAILREDGYLGKTGNNRNIPTQRAMEQGLFRIKETAITHSDGHVTLNRTPKVTGKGQRVFLERYGGLAEMVGV